MGIFELSSSPQDIVVAPGKESLHSKSRAQIVSEQTVRSAVPPTKVSQESLQVAARVKVLLGGTGSVVAVAGLNTQDGSAELAQTLAASLATIDRTSQVLLVQAGADDAAEHVPATRRLPGLKNLLERTVSLENALQPEELGNLFTLPIGEGTQSLVTLLSSAQSNVVFQRLRENYRYILIDAGVVRSGPSGMLLASLSDGVIAGMAAGAHRQHEVVEFQQELKRLSIPLLGFVLTQTT